MTRLLVSYAEFAADIREAWPRSDVQLYLGGSDRLPSDLGEVSFYVPPYVFEDGAFALARKMPNLRVIQLLTAGFEHVLPYLPAGVVMCNAQGVHDASTAELAVGLTLAALRGIPDFVRAQSSCRWTHAQYASLADRSVLILGYGSVGAAIERRLTPFEVQVVRVARRARESPAVHPISELTSLLPKADVVILAVPLTADTRHLVDAGFLAAMKSGALLVNVARGGVVDTSALVDVLGTGRITAALDVTDPEPLPLDHPLWELPGVLITPHVGGDSTAFLPRARQLVRDQTLRFLSDRPLENVVVG